MSLRLSGLLLALVLAGIGAWTATRAGSWPVFGRAAVCVWGKPGRARPGEFFRPRCVSVAPDGTVWVLDLTGRIQHFTPAGRYLGCIRLPDVSRGNPQGMDVDTAGNVLVADTHYHRILKFAPDGSLLLAFGRMGTGPGELFWPCAVAAAADGTIFTAQYGGIGSKGEVVERIQKWDARGRLLAYWGGFGEGRGEFMRPAGLALGPDGNLYVADSGNHRVQVYTRGGELVRTWGRQGSAPGHLQYPFGVALDGRGRVAVAEYGSSRVQLFSARGDPLWCWGRAGKDRHSLLQPWSLDFAPDGALFVADTYNHRIVRLDVAELMLRPAAPRRPPVAAPALPPAP